MEATAELFLQDGFEPEPGEDADAAAAAADGEQQPAADEAAGGDGGDGAGGRQHTHVTQSGRAVTIEEID